MYRLGHTGIALLVLAPLSYGLLEAHKPLLALIIALGILGIEPLPDFDFKLPFLSHRGVSHSLFAAVSIGGILALCGWVVGVQVVTGFASILGVTSEVVTTIATSLESLAPPESTGSVVTGTVGLLTEVVANLGWIESQLQGFDRPAIAGVGFVIGAGGILVHLLGDVITVSGIRPLLPFSDWKLSVSSLRANSTLGNTGFFAVGVFAVAVVLATTVAGIGFAAMPADLSPVGVAAGQTATQTQSQNATTATASVVFANQTTNSSTVTIERVTLPEDGFVAIHTSEYRGGPAPAEYSVIAVSQRLEAGTHRNITINISHAPPRNPPGLNRTRLNQTQTLSAVVYRDSNDNRQFDFVRSYGENDTAFTRANGSIVSDTARVRVPSPPPQIASVVVRNQTVQNNTLVVAKARLPRGGFLVALNESYRRTGDPLTSAVGLSAYLSPGTHRNVTIRVLPGALNESQTVTIIPALDTNGNQRYDYVRTGGFQDTAYVNRTSGQAVIVNDTAAVRVPSDQQGRSPTPTQTLTQATTTSSPTRGEVDESDGLIWGVGIVELVAILAVLVGIILIGRRVSR